MDCTGRFHFLVTAMLIAMVCAAQDGISLVDVSRGDTLVLARERIVSFKTDIDWVDGTLAGVDEFNVTLRTTVWRGGVAKDTLIVLARRKMEAIAFCRSEQAEDWASTGDRFDQDDVTINIATVTVAAAGVTLLIAGGDTETQQLGATIAILGTIVVNTVGNILSSRRYKRIKFGQRWQWL